MQLTWNQADLLYREHYKREGIIVIAGIGTTLEAGVICFSPAYTSNRLIVFSLFHLHGKGGRYQLPFPFCAWYRHTYLFNPT